MKTRILGLIVCAAISASAVTASAQSGAPLASPAESTGTAAACPSSPATLSGSAAPAPAPACLDKNGLPKKPKPRTDFVFSALVLATNVATPSEPIPELAAFGPRIKTIFGYNQLELVGSHTELMDDPDEHWLIPSKLFSLSVKSKREKNANYLLNLQLFQETKLLAGFDAKLGAESPIFIRGPLCGKGQLVIVLVVK